MNGEEIKRQINDAYYNDDMCSRYDLVDAVEDIVDDNAKLRELVRDMWRDGMCECGSRGKCASCEYDYPTRMRDLGVEVDG